MKLHIIYASTSGNVERVVEQIKKVLNSKNIEIILQRSEQTTIATIQKNNKFIFATSTWDHGKLNPFFQDLFDNMKTQNFAGKHAAFVGLGDTRYEPVLFCEGMDMIRDLWLDLGGSEIGSALRIQGEPYEKLTAVVDPWADLLSKNLNFYK